MKKISLVLNKQVITSDNDIYLICLLLPMDNFPGYPLKCYLFFYLTICCDGYCSGVQF